MNLDATIFLYIGVSGFITVYSYRYFTKSDKKLAEFEWLGLSTFVGVLLIAFLSCFHSYPHILELFANPFATALVASIFGVSFSFIGSKIMKK